MTFVSHYLSEPLLEFASGQKVEHPQDGLFLYGPVDTPDKPDVVRVGVIGTTSGINLVRGWLPKLICRIPVRDPEKLHTVMWPGFEAAFRAKLVTTPVAEIAIPAAAINTAIGRTNRTDAVRAAVKLFEDALTEHLRTEETRPSVWLVVVPEAVYTYGRPTVTGPKNATRSTLLSPREAKRILESGDLFAEAEEEAQTYLFARNFHHQLKCQLLGTDVVIQIVRETTIDPSLMLDNFGNPKRSVQEPAKIAWNFSTSLYFKAGAQP